MPKIGLGSVVRDDDVLARLDEIYRDLEHEAKRGFFEPAKLHALERRLRKATRTSRNTGATARHIDRIGKMMRLGHTSALVEYPLTFDEIRPVMWSLYRAHGGMAYDQPDERADRKSDSDETED